MNPRQQGDIGERAAAAWLLGKDAVVAYPFGHSPDWDLVAEIDLTLYRVQVKTSTYGFLIPAAATTCSCSSPMAASGSYRPRISEAVAVCYLVGPKYARFEVERGPAIFDYERRCASRSRIFAARGDARAAKGIAL